MAVIQDFEQKLKLVTRRQTFLNADDEASFTTLLKTKEHPKIAWETTPTGRPHVGYFIPLAKLIDFIRGGLDVTVYYLDVYGFLVNYIHSYEVVEYRRQYYHHLVVAILEILGAPIDRIKFVNESSFAYTKEFVKDSHRICTLMTQQDAKNTMSEVATTKMLSPMLCAVQQSLSEPYLDIDIQFGGEDQTGLFEHASKFIPMLGYRKREHLMNQMAEGLGCKKMSSTGLANTKIEFLDSPESVNQKVDQAPCEQGQVAGNGVLGLLRDILLPIWEVKTDLLRDSGTEIDSARVFCSRDAPVGAMFSIESSIDGTDAKHYSSYEDIERDFVGGQLTTTQLKKTVSSSFNILLAPIRERWFANTEWQAVDKLAYADGKGDW